MDTLLALLHDMKPDVDFSTNTSLIDGGILDSFDIVQLVGDLNDTFSIQITPRDLIPENFNSAAAMWKMIEALQKA